MADDYGTLGSDIVTWMKAPNWKKQVAQNIPLTRRLTQHVGGIPYIWNPIAQTLTPRRYQFEFLNQTKIEEKEMLDFFMDRLGQVKGFWMPTWITQFTLLEDAASGASTLSVEDTDFNLLTGEHYLIIFLQSGDVIIRRISSVTKMVDREILTLDSIINIDIAVSDVLQICLFLYCRLDQDIMTLDYITDAISKTTWTVYELINEYPSIGA